MAFLENFRGSLWAYFISPIYNRLFFQLQFQQLWDLYLLRTVKGLIFYWTGYLASSPTTVLTVPIEDSWVRIKGLYHNTVAAWTSSSWWFTVFQMSQGTMVHLKHMQLTGTTNSLLCPKWTGSWYSGLYAIIGKVSGKWRQIHHLVHTEFVSQLKCPELRKHRAYKRRLPANLPKLCSRKRHYLCNPGWQINLLFASERDAIFTFQSCLPYKYTWKYILEQKLPEYLLRRQARYL